jgi:hypothetical protein
MIAVERIDRAGNEPATRLPKNGRDQGADIQMTDATVVPFRSRQPAIAPHRHPRYLMDLVYQSGSIAIPADDRQNKIVAALLQGMGLVLIEEIGPDGAARRLAPGEARVTKARGPWRVVKPATGTGAEGEPDPDAAEIAG